MQRAVLILGEGSPRRTEMRLTTLATALAIAGFAAGGAYAQSQSPGASPAQPQGMQDGAYCLEGSDASAKNCTFATMASCEAAKKGAADKCAPNPAATTGSGTTGSPPMGGNQSR
jgi:hypothetical protein